MPIEKVSCLYCQRDNEVTNKTCSHCGMPVAKKPPQGVTNRRERFKKWFWPLVLFCIVMMFFLPR